MDLGPLPLSIVVATTVVIGAVALWPLRGGVTTVRQWIALIMVVLSAWFVIWPAAFDSGDHGLGGLGLIGIWLLFFLPTAGLGMAAGFALARDAHWARWLTRAWLVLSVGWASLLLVSWIVASGPYLGPSDQFRAIAVASHVLLLVCSITIAFLLARNRGTS